MSGAAAVSVDAVAAASPDCSEPGCTPMSASRLTVACCIDAVGRGAAAVVLVVEPPGPLDRAGAEDQRVPLRRSCRDRA